MKNGTEVKCGGTILWQKAVDPKWLVGTCVSCGVKYGQKPSAK